MDFTQYPMNYNEQSKTKTISLKNQRSTEISIYIIHCSIAINHYTLLTFEELRMIEIVNHSNGNINDEHGMV